MSGPRAIWNDGQGVATPDLQRGADAAACAEERGEEVLFAPTLVEPFVVVFNRVAPLDEGSALQKFLVEPATTTGQVRVRPAFFRAADPSAMYTTLRSGKLKAATDSTNVAANASGSTRYDLLYATLNRVVTVTGSRRVKSVVDGQVSTQTVNLEDQSAITLTLLPGTPGAGVPPALPADTATAWNFSLAVITVLNGYALHDAVTQARIQQTWYRTWLLPEMVRGTIPLEVASAPSSVSGDLLTSRWGMSKRFAVPIKLIAGESGSYHVLTDGRHNWSYRLFHARATYLGAIANFPLRSHSTQCANVPSVEGHGFSGAGHAATPFIAITYSGSAVLSLWLDSATGYLKYAWSGTLLNAATGDAVMLELDVSDRFDESCV